MGAQFVSLLTILIALGSVCFLAYIMTKIVGKKSSGMMKSKYMKVIDGLSLGFDKNLYLVQVGEQFVLMYSSVKGFDFICNIDSELIKPAIESTPEIGAKKFSKYFDFFKVNNSNEKTASADSSVDKNLQKLRDAFNRNK